MWDDGLHGDGAAGDGVYGAQIPAQPAGSSIAYSVTATYSDNTATVLDSAGNYTTTSPLAITTTSLPKALTSAGYNQSLAASGGTPAYTWSITAGSLPPGILLNSAGVFAGTATSAGTYTFTASAADSGGHTTSKSFTITSSVPPNVVIILTDDQGWGDIGCHTAPGQVPISTPNMDGIRTSGIRLEKFYATAVCSVTRAALLTGRNTIRTGVNNSRGLDLSEHTMPQSFKAAGYQTFMCGKWHLGGVLNNTNHTTLNGTRITIAQEGLQYAPYNRGWDYHKGTYTGSINYFTHISSEPELANQLDWWENGQLVNETTDLQGNGGYSTDLLADKAVELIQRRDTSKPFLLYLPFNAMHTQVSAPQSYLNKYSAITDPLRRTIAAAVECMDDGIGRVMRALDTEGITNNTILLFMSDNGGDEQYGAINDPLRGTKGDGYDGGIHTPAAIRFPSGLASGISSNQYVWVGDIFPTLCAATGVTPQNTKPFDGINLWPALQSINAGNPDGIARPVPLVTATNPPVALDRFNDPASGTTKVFKIIYDKYSATLPQQLFNMTDDPYETTDLLKTAQSGSYTAIAAALQTDITDLTAAAEVYPPYIGSPLITQSVAKGGTISLYAPFTCYGRAPTSAQWYKNGAAIGGTSAFTQAVNDAGNPISGIYTGTLTLSNLTLDDAGQYKLVITNAAGTTTSDTGTLTVILSAPVLDALPAYTRGVTCALTWPSVTNAISYSVQVSTDPTFASVLSSKTVNAPAADFQNLVSGVKYYYRANATDGISTSTYSGIVSSTQDATSPSVSITSPSSASTTTIPTITVQGTAADALSGIVSVVLNGVPATTNDNFAHWSATIPLDVDLNTLTAVASDGAQSPPNQSSASITITLTPTAPVVSNLTTGPTNPTYMDRVFATAKVRTGSTPLAKVELTYDASVPVVTKVFQEAFQPASTNNWNGTGAMNAWTVVGGASVRQAVGMANHTVPVTLTGCKMVAGSSSVTCDSTANLWPGMYLAGAGVQNSISGGTQGNTRVTSIPDQTSFVMSQPALSSGSGITVTACGVVLSNCKTTASSTTVTCDSTAGLVATMSLDGTGLANNATVASVTSGTSFTMNVAPTTASSPAAITITANGAALEFNNGTANLNDTSATTSNPINTTGSAAYVEFYLQTRSLSSTNNNSWTFQVYDGTSWNTRLSDSWATSTVTVSNCALNPTGAPTGSTTVSCASTAGLSTGRTVSGPAYIVSGTLTAGSAIMTCPNPAGLAVGMYLDSSKGMGVGARILAIDTSASPAQITMSANATSGTATAIAATYFTSTTTVTSIDPSGTSFTISDPAYAKTTASPITVSATTLNHGFQLYHYDLQGSELGPNTKLRFQFSGYTATPPNSNPRVDIDDIIVMTSTTSPPNTVTMYDDGLHGDGAAGDFIYGAAIPVQSAGTTVKYKVTATDTASNQTTWPAAGNYSYNVGSYLVDSTFENTEFLTIPSDTGITLTMAPLTDQEAFIEYGIAPGSYTASTPPGLFLASSGTMRIAVSGLKPDTKYFYRVRHRPPGQLSYNSRGERSFRTARPRGSSFVFTITADPHLDFATDPVLLSQAMANILADQPDFHIDLGDIFMTDKMADTVIGVPAIYGGGTPTQARVNLRAKIFRNYFELMCHSVPYFYTLGNHEAEYGYLFNAAADKRNNIPAWNLLARKAYYPAPTPNNFYTGNPTPMDYPGGTLGLLEDYYAWEWGDALFVVLDPFWNTVANPNQANDAWLWTLGKVQYDWLKTTLENSSARYKFLFMHHLVGGTPTLADGVTVNVSARGGIEVADRYEWGGRNRDGTDGFASRRPGWAMPIHQLLVANHVSAVFHGHDHLYAYQTLDGVVYLECPQPGTFNYTNYGSAPDGKYTQGVLIQNSGHIRVTVTPSGATSDYVRAYRPQDINASQTNRMISHSFTMAPTFYPPFEILSVTAAGSTLRWNAVPNKEYAIQWSPDLQSWSTIDRVTFPAVTTNATYTDTTHTNAIKGFYRISYIP
jgi:arylsulfatase A-like enzyme/phosphodiesterase/alkaline phosphatase D-like protein